MKDGPAPNYASGGDVTVTSESGKGSVFTVRLLGGQRTRRHDVP
jgi:hypothetical protein